MKADAPAAHAGGDGVVLTERGGEITLRALELGAIDFVTKPKLGIRDGLLEYTEIIADKIRAASRAKLRAPAPHAPAAAPARRCAARSPARKNW